MHRRQALIVGILMFLAAAAPVSAAPFVASGGGWIRIVLPGYVGEAWFDYDFLLDDALLAGYRFNFRPRDLLGQ